MPQSKAPKKSETIEIRLPYEAKTAFVAHCRAEGRTASETLRRLIDEQIAGPARSKVLGWRAVVVATVVGTAIGAAAGPTLASTSGVPALTSHQAHHSSGRQALDACSSR